MKFVMPSEFNRLSRTLWFLGCAVVFTVLSSLVAPAGWTQSIDIEVANAKVEERRSELMSYAEQIADAGEDELLSLREQVRALRLTADTEAGPIRARIEEVQADLARIGEEAPEGVSELPSIGTLRESLRAERETLDAIIGQTDLNITEANRLLIDIANGRRDAFYSRVLERDKPPFTITKVNAALGALSTDWETLQSRYASWKASFQTPNQFRTARLVLVLGILAAFVLLVPLTRWMDRSLLTAFKAHEPSPDRRAALAALRVVSSVLLALLAGTIVYQVAVANGVVTPETSQLTGSILLALATIFVVNHVAKAALAPKTPQWRIIPLDSTRATAVRFLLVLIVIVFSINAVLTRASEWLGSPRELVTLLSALLAVTGAVLIFMVVRPQLWRLTEKPGITLSGETLNFWRWIRSLISLVVVLCIFAVMVGHVALGRFVLTRIYFLAFLFAAAWFGRALLGEIADRIGQQFAEPAGAPGSARAADHQEGGRLFFFWLRLLIDIIVLTVTVPAGLLIVGVKWTDLRNWVFDAVFGIEVGGFTISLANIFSAFVAVFIIMLTTRFVQRTVDTRIFAQARMDSGLRNTFRTLIGYVGLIVGVMVGIGTLGFPLANLAIVAGALSLGIGFGLQSIVNNFVSGLILLFERPIKVGDWIVTSAGEGIVKRISVRSTEIETFDWASVIIPNSELVTSPVTNWTHKNRYTRLIVHIGVSYNADPDEVSELLLAIAKANRRTLSYPAPIVYFSNFGDSSLDFEVRIFINNVDDRIPVQNEIRIAIFKALQEAGIEIPFPQRDLHVRTSGPDLVAAPSRSATEEPED